MESENVVDLLRRYLEQQREFGYPDPILAMPAAAGESSGAAIVDEEDPEEAATLDELRAAIGDCARCALSAKRDKLVFGVGDPNADLIFVGEGPGADEDRIGEPFVGRAGQLLDKILAAVEIPRSEVYITNVVKCRPPGNRDPETDEILTCLPFLRRQIEIIDPKIICALGRHASSTLLGKPTPIGRARGAWHEFDGRKLICTYHPSACLRNPDYKRPVWDDFKLIRDAYREIRPV